MPAEEFFGKLRLHSHSCMLRRDIVPRRNPFQTERSGRSDGNNFRAVLVNTAFKERRRIEQNDAFPLPCECFRQTADICGDIGKNERFIAFFRVTVMKNELCDGSAVKRTVRQKHLRPELLRDFGETWHTLLHNGSCGGIGINHAASLFREPSAHGGFPRTGLTGQPDDNTVLHRYSPVIDSVPPEIPDMGIGEQTGEIADGACPLIDDVIAEGVMLLRKLHRLGAERHRNGCIEL